MKKLLTLFLCGMLWASSIGISTANTATNVDLTFKRLSPSSKAKLKFPDQSAARVDYGLYNFRIDWDRRGTAGPERIAGFSVAVESTPEKGDTLKYKLVSAENKTKWINAAFVFQNYEGGLLSDQAAQLAIWEVVFDNTKNKPFDLYHGNFKYKGNLSGNTHVVAAQEFLDTFNIGEFNGSGYVIARNNCNQDFIFHPPVPLPPSALLLFSGLACTLFITKTRPSLKT